MSAWGKSARYREGTVLPNPAIQAPGAAAPRIAALDMARGVALAAMAFYHLGWDLSSLRLIGPDVTASPGWQIAARLIAGSFLVLVGMGLVLAHGRGVGWRAFLRRLGLVVGAALLVTAVTAVAAPDGLIFFGILHCIAVSSVLALPFLRLAPWVTALLAALVVAAGLLVRAPFFDAPWLLWTGLGASVPATNDYVPVFPWFGWVLAGVAAARLGAPLLAGAAGWRPRSLPARILSWAGRHSLLVYLLHQPAMLAVLIPLSLKLGPNLEAAERSFARYFVFRCGETGAAPATCQAVLGCALEQLKGTEAWPRILQDLGWTGDEALLRDVTLACTREHRAVR